MLKIHYFLYNFLSKSKFFQITNSISNHFEIVTIFTNFSKIILVLYSVICMVFAREKGLSGHHVRTTTLSGVPRDH